MVARRTEEDTVSAGIRARVWNCRHIPTGLNPDALYNGSPALVAQRRMTGDVALLTSAETISFPIPQRWNSLLTITSPILDRCGP